jgi:hypothetical protein
MIVLTTGLLFSSEWACAGVKTAAIRETAEFALKKSGLEISEKALESTSSRITKLVANYGDDTISVARRNGLEAIARIEKAGPRGKQVMDLFIRHGDHAMFLTANQKRLNLVLHFGDDAASAIAKHGEIVEPLVSSFGQAGASAAKSLSGRQARRLATMMTDGPFRDSSSAKKLLQIIGQYGDRAMEFIWKNKGALCVAGGLTAFIRNPEPFISGAVTLSGTVSRHVTQTIGESFVKLATCTNGLILLVIAALTYECRRRFRMQSKCLLRHHNDCSNTNPTKHGPCRKGKIGQPCLTHNKISVR